MIRRGALYALFSAVIGMSALEAKVQIMNNGKHITVRGSVVGCSAIKIEPKDGVDTSDIFVSSFWYNPQAKDKAFQPRSGKKLEYDTEVKGIIHSVDAATVLPGKKAEYQIFAYRKMNSGEMSEDADEMSETQENMMFERVPTNEYFDVFAASDEECREASPIPLLLNSITLSQETLRGIYKVGGTLLVLAIAYAATQKTRFKGTGGALAEYAYGQGKEKVVQYTPDILQDLAASGYGKVAGAGIAVSKKAASAKKAVSDKFAKGKEKARLRVKSMFGNNTH